jgi:hypothetical protein
LGRGTVEIATNFNDFWPTLRVKHAFEKAALGKALFGTAKPAASKSEGRGVESTFGTTGAFHVA